MTSTTTTTISAHRPLYVTVTHPSSACRDGVIQRLIYNENAEGD